MNAAGAPSGDTAVLVAFDGVTLGYGTRIVLRDVRLDVRRGERWFLLGPNGEGKSTLIRALLGSLPPRSGRLATHPELEGYRRIGFVPQRCDPNPSMATTLGEFVELGLTGLRVPRGERRERLAEALKRVGLEGRAKGDYWSLSGGQRQRALLARALIRRPLLLVVDEPTNGLDWAAEAALLETLGRLNREECLTPIFVTHHLALALRHATHAALFHEGTVRAGPAGEIVTAANLERVYGRPVELEGGRLGAVRTAEASPGGRA